MKGMKMSIKGKEGNECSHTVDYDHVLACLDCGSSDIREHIAQREDAATIKAFIEALQIMAKYAKNGPDTTYFLEGQHDQILVYLTVEQLPEYSDDGKKLQALGWFVDDGCYWMRFT